MRLILVFIQCLFLFPLFSQNKAQNENYLIGQYIIQAERATDVNALIENLQVKNRNSQKNYSLKQIMDEPLNLWLVKYSNVIQYENIVNDLNSKRDILSVTPNRIIKQRLIPNDALINNQWQYKNVESGNDMDMFRAWDIATGGLSPSGDTIVVCVIDDGVNANHEDLQGNIWLNHEEIPGNGIDDDQNGYIDDHKGWNVKSENDDVYSGGNHGTPVVGIVGAKGNNAIGVSGVNWNVKVMMVNYGESSEANALSAYAYAYKMRKRYNESKGKNGAYIVATNASWGIDKTKAEQAPLWCALYDSLGRIGILNCGATANVNVDVDEEGDLPTSCESEYLISVTNLNKSDVKVNAAGYGRKSIDIGAYGQNAYTLTRSAYGGFGGTSGATPHVTGIVGLLYSIPCSIFDSIAHANPAGAALIAKDMILNGVSALTALNGITTTGGKLNAFKAASNLRSLCETNSPPSGIVISVQEESAVVTWLAGSESTTGTDRDLDEMEKAKGITLRYRKFTDINWIVINNFVNGSVIPNLQHCTEYEMQFSSQYGFLPNSFSYSKFFETGGCCTKPEIEILQRTEESLIINLTSAIPATYILQYKEVLGIWKDTLLQGNILELSNLPSCTAYQFRVNANCTKYGDFSGYTNLVDLSTSCGTCTEQPYCVIGKKDVSDEWIESFTLGETTIISGPSDIGYKSFAGLANIELEIGKEYLYKIVAGYSASSFADYYKILIDYNQDGQWSQDEYLLNTPSPERDSVMGSIIVPSNAKEGYTRLRVVMSYDPYEGGCDSNDFEYGEVEDYCVYIVAESCNNDVVTNVATVQNNSLTFSVAYIDERRENIKVSLRPLGTQDWTSIIGRDSIVFAGLDKCTLYEYQYYGFCGDRLSVPSRPDTVKTSCLNSVNDFQQEVSIRPNPTTNFLTISSNIGQLDNISITITDIAGKSVSYIQVIDSNDVIQLDISTLNEGVYILDLRNQEGQQFVSKIIKM
jgi:hypothetical protein